MKPIRTFELHRHQDVTGISGTGHVADGILWPDGTASVRWRGERPSVVFWDGGLASVVAIHGHGSATEIRWTELDKLTNRMVRIAQAHQKAVDSHGGTWGDCIECGEHWPCPTYAWATSDRDPVADPWDPDNDEPTT